MNNKHLFHNNFNYIQYTEPNIFNKRNFFLQNNKKENKNYNNNKNNFNRFRSTTKINKMNINNANNIVNKNERNGNIYSTKKQKLFDMRIYYCLKMLNLSHLQNKFESNNINFTDLLILSVKDLERLNIQKNDIIRIKRFSLDYIKNASYYSSEELEKYFMNKKIKKNYRKAISVGNMRRNQMVGYNKNNNDYNLINNMKLAPNNFRTQVVQDKYNAYSNYNNIDYIDKNRKINTEYNNDYESNKIINPNYSKYINNIYSNKNDINMYYNALTYNSNNRNNNILEQYFNQYYNDTNDGNRTKIQKNNLKTYYSQTKIENQKPKRNNNIKELSENQKRKINQIFSNKINSIRNKKINKKTNNNNNSNINNAQFLNEKEYNMFAQIQKMKKNSYKNLIKQKISNKNITNTKINNYINNIYNINKNTQGKNIKGNNGKSYRNKLISQNEIILNNNDINNLKQFINKNYTPESSNKKFIINFNNKMDNMNNVYYYNNRDRNMTLSNENRIKNLTYKNEILNNNQNFGYYPN